MITQLVNDELNKIINIVNLEKVRLSSDIVELNKSINVERFKSIGIDYDVDSMIFKIKDIIFGEAVAFEWKSFDSVFNLWKRRFDKWMETVLRKVESNEKELTKLDEFLSKTTDNVEINVSFGTNEIPVITHKFIKKFATIEKLVSKY